MKFDTAVILKRRKCSIRRVLKNSKLKSVWEEKVLNCDICDTVEARNSKFGKLLLLRHKSSFKMFSKIFAIEKRELEEGKCSKKNL